MDYDHVKKQLGYGIQTESKDNAIKAIEQLTARVRELEEEQRIAELIAELEHIREQKNRLWFEFSIATQQLAALKAELREICAAIDDPASDLTLTTVECIKKLKADNESLRKDAERYRWLRDATGETPLRPAAFGSEMYPDMRLKLDFPTIVSYDAVGNVTTLDQAIDAMAQGENRC